MSINQNIYIISGLGADERVFQKINFGKKLPIFIHWIQPLKNETLENYALRLSEQVKDKNPTIVGISFGGMLAVEISKFIPSCKLILIATAKTKYDIPLVYRLIGKTGLISIIPSSFLKSSNRLTSYYFGVSEKVDKEILKTILKDTDTQFLKWALKSITNWKNTSIPSSYIKIHGDNDKILPLKKREKNLLVIKNGGHLIPLSHSNEINLIFEREFN